MADRGAEAYPERKTRSSIVGLPAGPMPRNQVAGATFWVFSPSELTNVVSFVQVSHGLLDGQFRTKQQ